MKVEREIAVGPGCWRGIFSMKTSGLISSVKCVAGGYDV